MIARTNEGTNGLTVFKFEWRRRRQTAKSVLRSFRRSFRRSFVRSIWFSLSVLFSSLLFSFTHPTVASSFFVGRLRLSSSSRRHRSGGIKQWVVAIVVAIVVLVGFVVVVVVVVVVGDDVRSCVLCVDRCRAFGKRVFL